MKRNLMKNEMTNLNGRRLEIFSKENLGSVRTYLDKQGEPWFCLSDVCSILGLGNTTAVSRRLYEKGINSINTLTNGGKQSLIFIDEGNLYQTIMGSRKPEAREFADWVTREVIPSIRKRGYYSNVDYGTILENNPNELANLLDMASKAVRENASLKQEIKENKPKIQMLETLTGSVNTFDIKAVMDVLAFKGVGRNKVYQILVNEGIFYRDKNGLVRPHSKYIHTNELFVLVYYTYRGIDGHTKAAQKVQASINGAIFIHNLLEELGYQRCKFTEISYKNLREAERNLQEEITEEIF